MRLDIKVKPNQMLVGALLAVAVFLRLFKLDRFGLWYDELLLIESTIRNSSVVDIFIKHTLALQSHPPMHNFFVYFTSPLFPSSDLGYRLPSALLAIATVWSLYYICRKLFSQAVANLSLFIAVFSVGLISISYQCRYYVFIALVSLWFHYFLIRLFEKWRWSDFVWLVILGFLFSGTHYLGTYLSLTLPFILLFKRSLQCRSFRWLFLYLANFIAALPFFLSFLYLLLNIEKRVDTEWIPPVDVFFPIKLLDYFYYSGDVAMNSGLKFVDLKDQWFWFLLLLLVAWAVIYMIGFYKKRASLDRTDVSSKNAFVLLVVVLASGSLVVLVGLFARPLLLVRSFSYALPFAVIFASLLAYACNKKLRILLGCFIFLLSIFGLIRNKIYDQAHYFSVKPLLEGTIARFQVYQPNYVYCEEPMAHRDGNTDSRFYYPVFERYTKLLVPDPSRVFYACNQAEMNDQVLASPYLVVVTCASWRWLTNFVLSYKTHSKIDQYDRPDLFCSSSLLKRLGSE